MRSLRAAGAALLIAGLLSGCGSELRSAPESASPPNLLLITVDTLRPDALGFVSSSAVTPAIDRLARAGFAFPAALAPVPLTLPSHTSMLTGLIPRRHGVRDNGQPFAAPAATLAERLRERGYATAAFVSAFPLAAIFGLDRGFQLYDDELTGAASEVELERRADATTARALAWLAAAPPPWFAWVHTYDPHYPYEPPPEFARPGRRGAYDGEVAFTDHAIGELIDRLGRPGRGSILTVFAADHGESLGEHGEGTHGFFVYDSTLLVPLIFHFPGRIKPGVSAAPARLVDLAPTVLDLLDQPPLEGIDGVSLVPTLSGRPQRIPPAYVETYQPWFSYGWSPLRSIRRQGWKLIHAPALELYDLEADPGEQHNLAAGKPELVRDLLHLLEQAEAEPAVASRTVVDPHVLEQLRALGYAGSGAPSAPSEGAELRDPKSARALRDLLTEADLALRAGDQRRARSGFDRVLRQDPDNRFALLRSAAALSRLGELAEAIARLRRVVELDPQQWEARSALGEALVQAGKPEQAIEHWTALTELQPRRAYAWSNLGAALGLSGRIADAVAAMARAARLEPDNPERLVKLAFAEHAAARTADAIQHLELAARLHGEQPFPFAAALGLLHAQQGHRSEAKRWLALSRRSEGDFAAARFELARLELIDGEREQARRHLDEALAADPQLRAQALADPALAPLLP